MKRANSQGEGQGRNDGIENVVPLKLIERNGAYRNGEAEQGPHPENDEYAQRNLVIAALPILGERVQDRE